MLPAGATSATPGKNTGRLIPAGAGQARPPMMAGIGELLTLTGLSGTQGNKPGLVPGQFLQAVVSGKNRQGQWILTLGQEQFTIQSRLRFHAGQKLDLQVTAIRPKLTLQIVQPSGQLHLSRSLPLLARQNRLGQLIVQLAEHTEEHPDLSRSVRLFLQDMGRLPGSLRPGAAVSGPQASPARGLLEELREYVQQLLEQNKPGSPGIADHALAERLGRYARQLPQNDQVGELTRELVSLLTDRNREPGMPGAGAEKNLLVRDRLHTLFRALTDRLSRPAPSFPSPSIRGSDLQRYLHRLGLQQEHALLQGDLRQAEESLKHAMAEVERDAGSPEIREQAGEALRIIELFQIVKARFAEQGVVFYPLALPFLDQGYLVMDRRQSAADEQPDNDGKKECRLHLSLEGLGDLQIDIRQSADGLAICFHTADRERAMFLASFRDELLAGLSQGNRTAVQFLTGVEPPERVLSENLHRHGSGVIETTA